MNLPIFAGALGALALVLAGCSSNDMSSTNGDDAGTSAASAELPPTSGAAVDSWIAGGAYKKWNCEAAPHASRSPSPHGTNRICTNDLVSDFAGTGERPKGSAAVKEIYDGDGKINGYAVYLKTEDTSAAGANWYWYERIGDSVAADGLGTSGVAKTACVGCHTAAGIDEAHTPTPGGSDFVYTPVK
jgi:hypothetical protein